VWIALVGLVLLWLSIHLTPASYDGSRTCLLGFTG
jgi:hypothetical protein